MFSCLLPANADLYNREGEAELNKNEFNRALDFFTKGIDVKCNDDQLNAILYTNRATAHFNLGKRVLCMHVFETYSCCTAVSRQGYDTMACLGAGAHICIFQHSEK